MKIYDSLSNKKIEIVEPITIYCCGPTVYNDIHIGNARPIITFDVLNRFSLWLNKDVKFVHNITDIDDKIINAAKAANVPELELSNKYYLEYVKILESLNILKMTMPKVSDNMDGLINYIQKLIDSKHAYESDGDVYFDVGSIKEYGVLSHQNISQLKSGVRKELSKNKKSELDFALWKKTNDGIQWDTPWSKGRPGWHTECAYLINKNFGKQVQIHGGGIDLKFPHHENENAQNLAISKQNIAKVWMHVGHIKVNNEKMAKSLGNFVFVKDLLQKFGPNVIRWFMYQTQYENPINFSDQILNQAKDEFNKIVKTINQTLIDLTLKEVDVKLDSKYINPEFIDALNDDLDFPNAIKVIWADVKSLRTLFSTKKYDEVVKNITSLMNEFSILGIVYENILNDENKILIKKWKDALEAKDFATADSIRQQFKDKQLI